MSLGRQHPLLAWWKLVFCLLFILFLEPLGQPLQNESVPRKSGGHISEAGRQTGTLRGSEDS